MMSPNRALLGTLLDKNRLLYPDGAFILQVTRSYGVDRELNLGSHVKVQRERSLLFLEHLYVTKYMLFKVKDSLAVVLEILRIYYVAF